MESDFPVRTNTPYVNPPAGSHSASYVTLLGAPGLDFRPIPRLRGPVFLKARKRGYWVRPMAG